MSACKCLIAMLFVAVAVMATNILPPNAALYANANKSLIIGSRQPGDRLVVGESVIKASSWMKVQIVQKTFNVSRYQTITQVRALDQQINGTGATVTVLSGGPGHKNVTLKFKSQRSHSIKYYVEIYAR